MKKPIIGITCSEGKHKENDIQKINEDYIQAIIHAGGVPVLLPVCEQQDIIQQQIEMIDGLLVSGGVDVNPLFYHESYTPYLGQSSSKRDVYEINLIQSAAKLHKPILGICRGHQIINVSFGGTLFQDNIMAGDSILQHQQKERRDYPVHSIHIKKDSFLSEALKNENFVNSFHHQSVKKLASGFHAVAKSEDQIIEAMEHETLPIYSVQFHPEAMIYRNKEMLEIFCFFTKKCQ